MVEKTEPKTTTSDVKKISDKKVSVECEKSNNRSIKVTNLNGEVVVESQSVFVILVLYIVIFVFG